MRTTILLLLLSTVISAQIINDESLVAYYPLDGDTKDYSRYSLDGTGYNLDFTQDEGGESNHAYYFSGSNSYIEIPSNRYMKIGLPITISAKVFLNAYALPVFTNDYQDDIYTGALLFISSKGNVCVTLGNTGAINKTVSSRRTRIGTRVLELNKWYSIGCVINGFSDIDIYVNGEEDGGYYTGTANILAYSHGPATIGKKDQDVSGPAKSYSGKIDEVYFFNRALNTEEMRKIHGITTDVQSDVIPDEFSLSQNYPNPFNPTTRIDYSIKIQGHVTLSVYDIIGQKVLDLVDQHQAAGSYSVDFSAHNLPSGIYIYRLTSVGFVNQRKMILVK